MNQANFTIIDEIIDERPQPEEGEGPQSRAQLRNVTGSQRDEQLCILEACRPLLLPEQAAGLVWPSHKISRGIIMSS
jgi:hypothetical protein